MFLFVSHTVNCFLEEIPCQGLVVITLNIMRKSSASFQTEKVADKICYDGKTHVNIFLYIIYWFLFVVGAVIKNSTQTCKGCRLLFVFLR